MTKTIAQQLPQYDWKYDVEEGFYLDFVGLHWSDGPLRYRPAKTAKPHEVQRDVETLLRWIRTPELYDTPLLRLDFGDWGPVR